ncbi:MAG: glycosyltransferase [Bacteroidetes bacterium]|nr:glycosyltransferase [Bacteroidota bacterium]
MPCDVLFFSLFRTDNPYSSISLSMAREIARSQRVIYVNHPYSWKDIWQLWRQNDPALRRRLKGLIRGKVQMETLPQIPERFIGVIPPPTLPINWLPPGPLYRLLHNYNNRRVLRAIFKAVKQHNFTDFLYINCYNPFYAGTLPAYFGAKFQIYHCIDDISQDPYTARHGQWLEDEVIGNTDVCLVTSTRLGVLKKAKARRIEYFFNAADTALFSLAAGPSLPKPKEIALFNGPFIGFIGNMDALRIDYKLLKNIALAMPECQLLLVGPINSMEPDAIGLTHLPNVICTGARPLEALPAYLQYMNCVLIPFLCNTLTASIYPLKINEYLAAGKPVVSTAFSEDIQSFSAYIYLAKDHDDFVHQIKNALKENDPNLIQKRQKMAARNSWQARIEQLWHIAQPKLPNP